MEDESVAVGEEDERDVEDLTADVDLTLGEVDLALDLALLPPARGLGG